MTTAYDFPDLNISPILGEEDCSDYAAEARNSRGVHQEAAIHDALGGLSISDELSTMLTLPVEISSSAEGRGCRVCVEMGCCSESSEDVRSRLRRMGAIVSRRLTETTTHVVFSFGGRAAVLRRVFAVTNRPYLVDPHWVYECFNTKTRASEQRFSLYDCRFLFDALRKSLDAQNKSGHEDLSHANEADHQHSINAVSHTTEGRLLTSRTETLFHFGLSSWKSVYYQEVTFNSTMSASELLMKIDLLSKRLDKIGGGTTCVLGKRCPSALKGKMLVNTIAEENIVKATNTRKILRRRSHGAFPLEYREPQCDAIQLRRQMRDEQQAVSGAHIRADVDEVVVDKENAMGQRKKVRGVRHQQNRQEKGLTQRPRRRASDDDVVPIDNPPVRKCLAALENSSEIGGFLGFRTPSYGGVYRPLVETASSMINKLQLASTSEEFVEKRPERVVTKTRNGIVFTGFPRERQRQLQSDVHSLDLKVQAKITGRTFCVVSANGERTLNTLRAVVMGIPVVKPDWKRGRHSQLFSGFGKILVCDECSPPTEDLKWIIRESGGQITTNASECALVVAPHDHSLEITCSSDMEDPPPVVIERYILDCVCENEVLAVNDYMEHDIVDDHC
ncbi:unnamed protein product [Nippostrongylus brasiliensis]|uniref:BRCT domain-containing protein n=1 Tax=Nippostrongylus brasiliensis TaxID=27835 RepID=A0A158R2S9_NIPBR|nr:unnamed protein product [Nippostrongylus brasiliensis]